MKHSFRVLCAFKTANAAARQKLRGIYRYVAEGHDWDIRLIREEAELTATAIRRAEAEGVDGYLISVPNATKALKALATVKAPVAVIECDHPFLARRRRPTIFLRTDNRAIGAMAAAHFRAVCRSHFSNAVRPHASPVNDVTLSGASASLKPASRSSDQ